MVDLESLKDWLDIADDDDDSVLLGLESRAVSIIERTTGYSYAVADPFTESIVGDGTGTLWLSRNPTADPTALLEIPEVGDVGEAITAAQADGWARDGSRLLRKAGGVWTLGYRYQVTYSAGYEVGTEPADVYQAVLDITGILYRGRGKEGMANETTGPLYSYTKYDEAIADVIARLPYRPVLA